MNEQNGEWLFPRLTISIEALEGEIEDDIGDIKEEPTVLGRVIILSAETYSAKLDEDKTMIPPTFDLKEDPTSTGRVTGEDAEEVSADKPSAGQDEEKCSHSTSKSFGWLFSISSLILNLKLKGSSPNLTRYMVSLMIHKASSEFPSKPALSNSNLSSSSDNSS